MPMFIQLSCHQEMDMLRHTHKYELCKGFRLVFFIYVFNSELLSVSIKFFSKFKIAARFLRYIVDRRME